MFSGNEVANTFSCGENKTAYLAKFGLAPFIKKQLVSQVSDDNFVLIFDENLNGSTKNKQFTLDFGYWMRVVFTCSQDILTLSSWDTRQHRIF